MRLANKLSSRFNLGQRAMPFMNGRVFGTQAMDPEKAAEIMEANKLSLGIFAK